MSLQSIGNCQHYWEFNSTNFSSNAFQDLVGSVNPTLNTGTPTYTSFNSVEGLDLSGGTQYLEFPDTKVLGEMSVISVIGYRGGGLTYGLSTLSTTTGFNFRMQCTSNTPQFWRSVGASNSSEVSQSSVNVHSYGVRLEDGLIWSRVDDNTEATASSVADKNDSAINTHSNWQFGRYGTTLDPMQLVFEIAVYIDDISQDPDYETEIQALLTKYGI